jgi:hypothetical protein
MSGFVKPEAAGRSFPLAISGRPRSLEVGR